METFNRTWSGICLGQSGPLSRFQRQPGRQVHPWEWLGPSRAGMGRPPSSYHWGHLSWPMDATHLLVYPIGSQGFFGPHNVPQMIKDFKP